MSSPPRKNGKGPADGSEIPNEIISLPGPAVDEDPSVAQHEGVLCTGVNCGRNGKWIHGVRYKCSVCKQQDFCSSCVGQEDNGHDTSHPLYECIGPSEFIEARRLTTGELVFPEPAPDGLPELLKLNNLCVNVESEANKEPPLPTCPLRYIPKAYCGLSLGNVEHYQDAGLLARVILGRVTKFDYKDCQLRDFPGPRPALARLLEVNPGNPGDKVECQFRLKRLDDNEPYEAVCCKWRDLVLGANQEGIADLLATERKHAVYVGEQRFLEASSAAFEALQAMRDPEKTKLVWIEELCIDAAHEKRFQNRSRSLVMSSAAKVVMWAGESFEGAEEAFGLMPMLLHHYNGESTQLRAPAQVEDLDLPPLGSKEWQALFHLFPREVAKFHWELEDVSFAKHPVLRCGDYQADWWDTVSIMKMLAQDGWSEHLKA